MAELKLFTAKFIAARLTPLQEVMTFEKYLESTHYTKRVKQDMLKYWDAQDRHLSAQATHKAGFIKTERYPGYKHYRGIHGCSLDEKCYCGPGVKSVEHAVYSQLSQYFLKGVPTNRKAHAIVDKLGTVGGLFLGLDVTSWESSVTEDVADACELQLYDYMLCAAAPEVAKYIRNEQLSAHKIRYRDFLVKVRGGRMSGDLWTSLGNGFTNLMIVLYTCSKLGYSPPGVVEGDDGLFRLEGPPPTKDMFALLGFDAKIELFTSVGSAGFCKMKFDEELTHICDPVEKLCKFGWTTSIKASERTRLNLLYTKALSLKAEYPCCPIVSPFADYVIRCVKRSAKHRLKWVFDEDRSWNQMKLERGEDWTSRPSVVPLNARVFMEHTYGITVASQLSIESDFTGDDLRVIDNKLLTDLMKPVWHDCYMRFVSDSSNSDVDW